MKEKGTERNRKKGQAREWEREREKECRLELVMENGNCEPQ